MSQLVNFRKKKMHAGGREEDAKNKTRTKKRSNI